MKKIMNNVIFKFLSSSLACFNERGVLMLINLFGTLHLSDIRCGWKNTKKAFK